MRRHYHLVALFLLCAAMIGTMKLAPSVSAKPELVSRQYLPLVSGTRVPDCHFGDYALLSANGGPPDRDHEGHADLKLTVRGWQPTSAYPGLVLYNGPTDPSAPDLATLFAPARIPALVGTYQVFDWDWNCNCRGGPITTWAVTLSEAVTAPGEPIHLPNRPGGEIDPAGYKALVIYANETSITLKYTRDNNVVSGYTLHVDGVCVDPSLVALYRAANAAGRSTMPALRPFQPFGRAIGDRLRFAIRDNGSFMDPRSCKDWWAGRCNGAPPAEEDER